ncbi:MAG: phospho-sugar mutase [Simkaniaceae bacterium]
MSFSKNVESWLQGPIEQSMRDEILRLQKEDPSELQSAFSEPLSFGTGGVREKMGVGFGRLNRYTIRMATKGLSLYLKRFFKNPKVFISYDNRHHSREFAIEAAQVLAADGVKAYVTKELRPTPIVSFGVRQYGCSAGIMITASHNPPEYNGYKVYWADGAQVVSPHDLGIVDEVKKITDPFAIALKDEFEWVDASFDKTFIEAILPYQFYRDENRRTGHELKIIYSPLHGAGITLTPLALKEAGFTTLSLVKQQSTPDGNFPNAPFPNPEERNALQLGIEQMIKEEADLFLSNDPDADRIGCVVFHKSVPRQLNGNEMALILLYHILNSHEINKSLPKKGAVCTTIVTTSLLKIISEAFHQKCFEVLTGFKYIGEKIHEWEEGNQKYKFLFGAEESQGYLLGPYARDKDGVSANLLLAEIALQLKKEGLTLIDLLHLIYEKYGLYRNVMLSKNFEGVEGKKKMSEKMMQLRNHPPSKLSGVEVASIDDYLNQERLNLKEGTKEPLPLPKSDVIAFHLKDHNRFIFRPSGTEPKLKIYAQTQKEITKPIQKAIEEADLDLEKKVKKLIDEL